MTDTIHDDTRTIARSDAATPVVWRHGLVAGLAAAGATTATAAIAHWSGVSLAIAGESIPLIAFGQLTMLGAVIGIAVAAVLLRRSTRPRTLFVRTTVVLLMVSIVPDLVVDADTATRLLLVGTHLIAAAIVIPALARRLPS